MNTITIENDMTFIYVEATSFPDGVMESWNELHRIIPFNSERVYVGLSRPEGNKGIVYKACALILNTDETTFGLQQIALLKGDYFSEEYPDYMKDLQKIGTIFHSMLSSPEIDPEGYCVEWYLGKEDLRCMVKIK